MKNFKSAFTAIFIAAAAGLCGCTHYNGNVTELPLVIHDGFGPIPWGMGGLSFYSENKGNPWRNTYLKISGIPSGWTDLKTGSMETNIYQSIYQNYINGKITREWYENLQKSWNWIPDTLNLSKKAVKTKIAFACGRDSSGALIMVVDADNNHDLSNDKPFAPVEITKDMIGKDTSVLKHAVEVAYEKYEKGRIKTVHSKLLVAYMPEYKMYMYCFPQYATAKLNGTQLAVSSDNSANISYNSPVVAVVNDSLKSIDGNFKTGALISRDKLFFKGQYIALGNDRYKILGVNTNKNVLELVRADEPLDSLYSSQIGYRAFPFEGRKFGTDSTISLKNLKGKYVLLDFWSLWCGPCRREMPLLRKIYDGADKSSLEIVGIICESSPDNIKSFLPGSDINWPQIISDEKNNIGAVYGIEGYPTNFLINPNGVIVARDVHGQDLEKLLKKY